MGANISMDNLFVSGLAGALALVCVGIVLQYRYRLKRMTGLLERQAEQISSQNQLLEESRQATINSKRLATAVEHAAEGVAITDRHGVLQYVNPAFENITGYSSSDAIGRKTSLLRSGRHDQHFYETLWQTITSGSIWSGHMTNRRKDGKLYEEEMTISPIRCPQTNEIISFVAVKRDVTEQLQLESQLQQSQKLESIGQLAAGIAHEINSPTQYINDNTVFLKRAFTGLVKVMESSWNLLESARQGTVDAAIVEHTEAAFKSAKLEFMIREVPLALEQSLEGLERVSGIVSAMKEFSHPAVEMTPIDLNRAIQSTATVARNEWKYVSELELNLDPLLPPLTCIPGDINQVVLIMIVNAAHAIAGVLEPGQAEKGTITISTRQIGDQLEINIADTGTGMNDEVKSHIFEAFYTTKEVGKGSGQGLNIAWNVVVNKHQGVINVDSQPNQGTCFHIRIPQAGVNPEPQRDAA